MNYMNSGIEQDVRHSFLAMGVFFKKIGARGSHLGSPQQHEEGEEVLRVSIRGVGGFGLTGVDAGVAVGAVVEGLGEVEVGVDLIVVAGGGGG